MALLFLFTLAGFALGSHFYDLPGAIGGALLALMLGWVAILTKRIESLEQDVARLRAPAVAAFAPERAPDPELEPWTPEPQQPADEDYPDLLGDTSGDELPSVEAPYRSTDLTNRIKALALRFFTQGNPVVRTGMVVMFFGLGFLIKYVAAQGLFPIEMRLLTVAAVALGLIVIGWRTRHREAGYGLVLQGGGIGALYLTVFAATKLYPLLSPALAFGLMFLIVMVGVAMAVLQNAQTLAIMASAGGFLAPILTSDGTGSHITLFSFYLVLNLGILAVALFKTWRPLNWTGFVFTFGITSVWCLMQYRPEHYFSAQLFIGAFFALYLGVSILFSLRQPPRLKGLVDGSLIFGLPIVVFGLQSALLKHTEHGLELSAVGLAALYLFCAALLRRPVGHALRLLYESFVALGVLFATLAVPLTLDAEWTSATWALEATGLIWIGLRQRQRLPRLAGYVLYALAAAALVIIGGIETGTRAMLDGDFIGLTILAAAALLISYLSERYADNLTDREGWVLPTSLTFGWGWWLIAGGNEIAAHLDASWIFTAGALFTTLSTVLITLLAGRLQWHAAWRIGAALLPLMLLWALLHAMLSQGAHPSQGIGLLAWPVYALVQYWILWLHQGQLEPRLRHACHVLSAWFLLGLLFWEASWWQQDMAWVGVSALGLWFASIALPLGLLLLQLPGRRWPFDQQTLAYRDLIPAPLMALLVLWYALASTYSGSYGPTYIPLLNPLDAMQAAALIVLALAVRKGAAATASLDGRATLGVLALGGFTWLNLLVLRSIHHYADVPFSATGLWTSFTVQMALSILWTLCALGTMRLARAQQSRPLWFVGVGLLGVVVIKLFTKDLTGTGTLARIVSFLAVGSLMLLIGYISPTPAKQQDKAIA